MKRQDRWFKEKGTYWANQWWWHWRSKKRKWDLKHELKIVALKLSLKKNGGKNDSKIKDENKGLRSQLSKVTSK